MRWGSGTERVPSVVTNPSKVPVLEGERRAASIPSFQTHRNPHPGGSTQLP